jgi:hypothetical protein
MLIETGQQLMSIGNDWGRDVRTLIASGGAALAPVPASIARSSDQVTCTWASDSHRHSLMISGRFLIRRRVGGDLVRSWTFADGRDRPSVPERIDENAYRSGAFGKWHLTPDGQQGPAGPFDRWPSGWGFDYLLRHPGGGSSQSDPCLAENQKIIGTPEEFRQLNCLVR